MPFYRSRKKFLDALLALLGGAVDCSLKLKVASIASELAGFILEPEECPEIARLAVDQAQVGCPIQHEPSILPPR